MSIKSDVYAWIESMTAGTTFSIVDCPNHSKQTKTQEWAGIRSAEVYGLCVRTGLTVPVKYTVACEYVRV